MRSPLPLFALAVLMGGALAGCGGGGGTRLGGTDDSDFEGVYTGTFVSRDGTINGTLNLTVDDDGGITGTSTDSRRTGGGTVDRTTSFFRSATLSLSLAYPGATDDYVGRMDRAANGVVTGTVQQRAGSGAILYDVTLTPTP